MNYSLSSGFVWFVLSLVKKYYLRQFSLFAWTHVALLCVVSQSYLIIQNMFQVVQINQLINPINSLIKNVMLNNKQLLPIYKQLPLIEFPTI